MYPFLSYWGGVLSSRLFAALMVLTCLTTALLWSPCAHAHAALVSSEPAQGSTLETMPETFALRFNEPVSPLVFKLLAPNGSALPLDEVRQQDENLIVAVPDLQTHGSYVLSWRVVSADGHPVGGSLLFAFGTASEPAVMASQDATQENQTRKMALWVVRVLVYLGLFLGVGSAVFRAFLVPSPVGVGNVGGRATGSNWLLLGAVATLLSVYLFGVDALDAPLSAWDQGAVWQAAWSSTVGLAAMLIWGALACAWLSKRLHSPGTVWRRLIVAAALLMLGLALASSGHASLATPQWLARPAVWLHGIAIALWIGSLLPLGSSLRPQALNSDLLPLRRFSQVIPWVVAGLLISGVILAWLQLGRLQALWVTEYGQVLLLKLGLVLVLLGMGALNRYRWTQPTLHGDVVARHRLRRVTGLEVGIAILILSTAALWRFTPPPRSLPTVQAASSEARVFSVHLHGPAAMAELHFKPADNAQGRSLDIQLLDAANAPLSAQAVEVVFSNTESGIEPISYPATRLQQGQWQIQPLHLPNFSKWQVQVHALVSDFDRLTLQTDFTFPSSRESK